MIYQITKNASLAIQKL